MRNAQELLHPSCEVKLPSKTSLREAEDQSPTGRHSESSHIMVLLFKWRWPTTAAQPAPTINAACQCLKLSVLCEPLFCTMNFRIYWRPTHCKTVPHMFMHGRDSAPVSLHNALSPQQRKHVHHGTPEPEQHSAKATQVLWSLALDLLPSISAVQGSLG